MADAPVTFKVGAKQDEGIVVFRVITQAGKARSYLLQPDNARAIAASLCEAASIIKPPEKMI